MNKTKKLWLVIQRKIIGVLNYIAPDYYKKAYNAYLKKIGICFSGGDMPNYIDPTAHFDGVDYSLISIGSNVVISREVLLLTHDYSIFRGLKSIGRENEGERIVAGIIIGDNVFIGARSTLLPGTVVGNNVIVGACTVVKGNIPDNVVITGNPARIIKSTEEYANKWLQKHGKV